MCSDPNIETAVEPKSPEISQHRKLIQWIKRMNREDVAYTKTLIRRQDSKESKHHRAKAQRMI